MVPPNDIYSCGGRINDVVNSSGSYAMHALGLRQPFDFANRTGTVSWELGGRVRGQAGWWPEIWLAEDLKEAPTLEAYLRVKKLLEDIGRRPLSAEQIRQLRAIEVLEKIGTPAVRPVLQRLAQGAPSARQTGDARTALLRLRFRR